jgi:hypothetical protein
VSSDRIFQAGNVPVRTHSSEREIFHHFHLASRPIKLQLDKNFPVFTFLSILLGPLALAFTAREMMLVTFSPNGFSQIHRNFAPICSNYDRPQRVLMLNKAIQLAPEFREALFWRGILRFQNVSENLEDLQKALSLTKRDTSQYLVILGQVLFVFFSLLTWKRHLQCS